MILDKNIINQLAMQEGQHKLITGEYIRDENNENFKYIKDKFYKKEEIDKVKTLNNGSGIFETVALVISHFVGNPDLQIKMNISEMVKDYCVFGDCVFCLERIGGKLQVVYLPKKNHIRTGGIDYIIRAYQKIKDNTTITYYLITMYSGGIVENHLYKQEALSFKEVSLTDIDETSELEPVIDTKLSKCFWNIKSQEKESSIINKIKNIVYSIDRKIVMFDTQFLQNVENFVIIKGIDLPISVMKDYNEGSKINFSDIGRYIKGNSEASIEFVDNSNKLIQQAIDYELEQKKKISSITTIPLDFLGGTGTAGAIGEGSRELLHGSFMKYIVSIRQIFDTFLTSLIDEVRKEDSSVLDKYSRPDVYSRSNKDIIDELSLARTSKLISQKTAIMRYLDYDESEAEIEIKQIILEDQQSINASNIGQNQNNVGNGNQGSQTNNMK